MANADIARHLRDEARKRGDAAEAARQQAAKEAAERADRDRARRR